MQNRCSEYLLYIVDFFSDSYPIEKYLQLFLDLTFVCEWTYVKVMEEIILIL